MSVRSPPLFAVSLLLLASATTLGVVLVHDGEVGTDEAFLPYAEEGDLVKVKGTLTLFHGDDPVWAEYQDNFHHTTYRLVVESLDADVLVTGMQADMAADQVVIEGAIVHNGEHPIEGTLLILDAEVVTAPFFDW